MSDHYQTLGVSRDASADEIKRSYRKLARELHPDVNPDPEVQDKFKEITAAYETLSDPKKRQNYDMGGSNFGGANFGGGFSDIMDAFFGGGGSRGPRPRMRAGQDSLIRIEVDLHEACFGVERDISVESAVVCPKCTGSGCVDGGQPTVCTVCKGRGETQQVVRSVIGQVMTSRPCGPCSGYGSIIANPCRECAGEGRVRARQDIHVKIPAGVETGNRIQLTGRGWQHLCLRGALSGGYPPDRERSTPEPATCSPFARSHSRHSGPCAGQWRQHLAQLFQRQRREGPFSV